MKRKAYLMIIPAVVIALGVSFASMHSNEPNTDSSINLTDQTKQQNPIIPVQVHRGKLLYENHCTGCHNSNIHSRHSDKVKSLHDIRKWVIRWSRNLQLNWEDKDIDMVTEYLNTQFYRFTE